MELSQARHGGRPKLDIRALSGSSLVVSPYRDSEQRIVGVLGVIGPTRLNYARVIPMVDYAARIVSQMLGK